MLFSGWSLADPSWLKISEMGAISLNLSALVVLSTQLGALQLLWLFWQSCQFWELPQTRLWRSYWRHARCFHAANQSALSIISIIIQKTYVKLISGRVWIRTAAARFIIFLNTILGYLDSLVSFFGLNGANQILHGPHVPSLVYYMRKHGLSRWALI